MKFRNLDSDGDWTFGKGKHNYVSEQEALKLNVKTRLLEWVNDCFFNMTAGIDYLNRLDKGQRQNLENDIKSIILNSEGVTEITSFYTTLVSRVFTAQYQVKTIYSKTFIDTLEVK